MRIFRDPDNLPDFRNAVVTLGTFDGVHKGHQQILKRIKERAKALNGESILLTFWPHPRMVLQPDDNNLQLLNTIDEKIELLEKSGLDNLIIIPFTLEFSRITYLDFIRDFLVEKLNTKAIIVGYDHHFGKNREGSFEQLEECAPIYNFELEQVPAEMDGDISISSTKIRNAILEGNVKKAASCLGYPYMVNGKVVSGRKMGRELGFPTANIEVDEKYKLVPADGVYAVQVKIAEKLYNGMANIGNRPTFFGLSKALEVNIFDFNEQIYDAKISIFFMEKLRKETKFANVEALKEQLSADKREALRVLTNPKKV